MIPESQYGQLQRISSYPIEPWLIAKLYGTIFKIKAENSCSPTTTYNFGSYSLVLLKRMMSEDVPMTLKDMRKS